VLCLDIGRGLVLLQDLGRVWGLGQELGQSLGRYLGQELQHYLVQG